MTYAITRVVVGVHGSPGSLEALRFAVDQARALDATLVPVLAWEAPGGDSPLRPYPEDVVEQWAQAAVARLQTAFDEGLGLVPERLSVEPWVVRGRAGSVLVAVADQPGDVLVVGKAHHRALHRAWYGSTEQHCLRHAQCTVLVVPPTALARELGRAWSRMRVHRALTR